MSAVGAASRVAADTIPGELQRQSDRIEEQLQQLNHILTTASESLDSVKSTLSKVDDGAVSNNLDTLKSLIERYQERVNDIYGDVADSLRAYSTNILKSVEDLAANISKLNESVGAL